MGMWNNVMLRLGLAEDELEEEIATYRGPVDEAPDRGQPEPASTTVRKIVSEAPPARPRRGPAALRAVAPRSYDDAREIGDALREGAPAVVDLRSADADLATRIAAFACGLAYALDGGVRKAGGGRLVVTPRGVEVREEDVARLSRSPGAAWTISGEGTGRWTIGA